MNLKKKLGQHILIDKEILKYEVEMAGVREKVVLEIGGGPGNLTELIAKVAQKVITIEKDPNFVEILKKKFSGEKKVKVIEGDFLELKQNEIEREIDDEKIDVIVGNIPYYISSQILFRLLEWKFENALLCFQKEFAERMVAKSGTKQYGRLSVMSQIYFKPIFLRRINATSFRPVPKVDSALIYLTKTKIKRNKKRDEIIRMLFSHKKKTILAALKSREFDEETKRFLIDKVKKLKLENKKIFQISPDEIKKLVDQC